jgi:hypothetical protein
VISPDVRALLAGPRDFAGVHASWLAGFDLSPVGIWKLRWLGWPPVPVAPDPLPALVSAGRDQLAFATGLTTGLLAGARTAHLTDRRAAIARCAGVQLDELGLIRVGVRTLVLSPLARQQLVLRLPRPIGLALSRDP